MLERSIDSAHIGLLSGCAVVASFSWIFKELAHILVNRSLLGKEFLEQSDLVGGAQAPPVR
jgi:hypothetical protein